MDATFQFPRHMAPIPRPAPSVSSATSYNRESNALRASVLDAALELGIGHNSTVLNWMFNNSLTEEDEEEPRSPLLTHESPETSEESSFGRSPLTPSPTYAQPSFQPIPAKLFPVENRIQFDKYVDQKPDQPVAGGGITFSDPPVPSHPTTPSRGKLRKKRADGYESDGGYMSDGGKKKKEREKEAKERAKEEKQQEKREKEEERKRKKSMKVKKGEDKDGHGTGYDTDGASKKSKGKAGDGGYETDSGYLSSTSTKGKSKGRFFGLKSKQPKVELRWEEVPPMPAVEKEPVVLPIASKFATTIDGPLITGESLDSMISKAMDGPMASVFATPSVTTFTSSFPTASSHTIPATSFSPTSRESIGSTESSGSMSASASSLSHSHSQRRGPQYLGQDLVPNGGSGSHLNTTPPLQIPLPPSAVSSQWSTTHPPISLPYTHSSKRNPTPTDTSVESSAQHSPSRSPSSPPSAFSPAQHSSSHSLSNPPSAFSPVQHSSSNSLNNPPSAFSPVQHYSSNSLNSSPAFTPQVFPTARNPLSRGLSFTRTQVTTELVSTSEPSIPLSPVSAPPTQPFHSLPATQPTRLSTSAAVQPRLSPTSIPQSPSRLPPTTPTSPSRPPLTATTQALRPRPRNPPTDGFGPRPTLIPSTIPSTPSSPRSPSPTGSGQSLTIIPSTDYIVPSPRVFTPSTDYIVPSPRVSPLPLPSPSVLAYYDIPPPSPPPSGPLPKIPPPGSVSTRSRTLERPANGIVARSRTPEPRVFNQPIPSIQRGRESPFPPRPILPQTTVPSIGPGLEANVKVPRYRELYGLPLPKEKKDQAVEQREVDKSREWVKERDSMAKRSSDGSWDAIAAYGGSEYDDDEEDMRDVLERFEEARIDTEIDALQNELNGGKALGRSRSFEAIKKRITGRYEGDQDSEYYEDNDEDEVPRKSMDDDGDTNSRWSGTMSIYSRASVLDPEKSEEARQRFIKRVEDLYEDGGREKIPPVPKIPDAFIDGSARSWTRF
ncbi:hypothetical protein C0995_004557 [Termitomyces sp. Mi166|nr:hypothetical protein C0995_004557 [Termitomyces sp. Mi166\